MIEMMRLGFADGRAHVADEAHMSVSVEQLLDPKRINDRAESLFEPEKATIAGTPIASSCTVSFQVVDKDGNAISFVNSNYMGFGTGIVPSGCGFTLQNRGFGFTLEQNHPNVVAPRKRPYHTIIPGMITYSDTNELHSTISNMGGNMQPQGHLQLTVDMVAGGLDPQAAIDLPRFCIADGTKDGMVQIEGGVEEKDILELKVRGHNLQDNVFGHARSVFGRAQIIKRNRQTGVLWGGSDGRADGCAIGF
jgi:gamma-glutamyltranspeptidase/glutathione hydrolase